ncbi:MAG: DUF2480 family protein [Sphingobacteriaceae bacterium]|nr:DUF2480 family protein [Sphingobacteriaceae bacterium]
MELIQNKVAESGILVLDPAQYLAEIQVEAFDLKDFLFHGMVLREKDFREQLKSFDWQTYAGKFVALHCSTEAILPTWAFMLVTQYLHGVGAKVAAATVAGMREQLALATIQQADFRVYADAKVILKGCGDENVPASLYTALSSALLPHVKSLMYGEPCSTVPVYKKK